MVKGEVRIKGGRWKLKREKREKKRERERERSTKL